MSNTLEQHTHALIERLAELHTLGEPSYGTTAQEHFAEYFGQYGRANGLSRLETELSSHQLTRLVSGLSGYVTTGATTYLARTDR